MEWCIIKTSAPLKIKRPLIENPVECSHHKNIYKGVFYERLQSS